MKRPHYAWAVCLSGTLLLFTTVGLGVNVFSVFQPYILEYGGLTNTQGGFLVTVRSFFIMIGMMTAGNLVEKMGLRRTGAFALILLAASSFLFGITRNFLLNCVASALVGLVYSWGGVIPASLLVNRWFRDRQALALGIISAGTGMATIIAPIPLTNLIQTVSLKAGFWAEGLFSLLMALLFWLIIRDDPAELNLAAYQHQFGSADASVTLSRPAPPTLTKAQWSCILVVAFLVGASTSLGITNMGVLYTGEGFSPDAVARLVSCMGLCMTIGKIAYGQIVDNIGGRLSNYILYALILVGFFLACMSSSQSLPLAFVSMTLAGLGLPLSAVSPPIWAKDLCQPENYAKGLKWIQSIYALGIFLVGPVPGILADATGSYIPTYAMFFAMLVISLLLLAWVYERTHAGGPPIRSKTES